MYPALLAIITAALVAALYAELAGAFSGDEEPMRPRKLRPIESPNHRSRRR